MNVFTATEMHEADRRAAADYCLAGICLMEAAGVALAAATAEELGGTVRGKTVAVLCGKGNNGGDGFVAARHLLAAGADVRLFLLGAEPGDLSGDAAAHSAPLSTLGVPLTVFADVSEGAADLSALSDILPHAALVLDCVYGTGFRPPLPPLVARVAWLVAESGVPVVSCDMPSGVDADTGATGNTVPFRARRTVTLAGLKRGLLLYPGAEYAGRVTVAPIGFPRAVLDTLATATLTDGDWVRGKLRRRTQSRDANKGRFGTVLVIAGTWGMAGAATLSSVSALRAGAGLVHLALPQSVIDTAAVLAPELVLKPLPETAARSHGGSGALEQALALAERADVVALGPGIGADDETKSFARTFIRRLPAHTPLVVDADGLNALADGGADVIAHRSGTNTVLTPHPGEMARLLRLETGAVQEKRAEMVKQAARMYHATVLLKGARTLIATDGEPDRLYINRAGSVTLATAGSGDVLTGVVAALIANRENALSALDAARAGAYLHAVAGEVCEAKRGAVGTLATEIRDALPDARVWITEETGATPED